MQGECQFDLRSLGDFVMRRRDGVIAYQLAVVVDDAKQGITDVIRGADLLASTAWQIALQRALDSATPRYGHLPLIVESTQGKLSKSRRSVALDPSRAVPQLIAALQLLQHPPPAELEQARASELLAWAGNDWSLHRLHGLREVTLPAA